MTQTERVALRESWQRRVADYRTSGQSGAAWCAANQVTESQLWYWVGKFRAEERANEAPTDWVTVRVANPSGMEAQSLPVRIGQATIEVKTGYDPALLRDVVRTLATLC